MKDPREEGYLGIHELRFMKSYNLDDKGEEDEIMDRKRRQRRSRGDECMEEGICLDTNIQEPPCTRSKKGS